MHSRVVRAFGCAALVCLGSSLRADTLQVRDDAYLTVASKGPNRGRSHGILVGRFGEKPDRAADILASQHQDRGGTRLGLIRFDLASQTNAVTLERATLRLWVSRVHHAGSLNIAPILEDWGERSVTGPNAPALGQAVGSLNVREQDEREFLTSEVTSLVQEWLDHPESEHGLALVPASDNPLRVEFDSKENTLTSHPAELELTFVTGGAPGPQGPPGPTGPAGPPLASLNALAGIPCSLSGADGTIQLSYSTGGVATLTCIVSQVPVTLSVTKNGAPSAVMMGRVDANTGPVDCGSTCSGSYLFGDMITLTETHPGMLYFLGWGGDCLSAGTASTCTLTLNGDRSVTARFEQQVQVSVQTNSPLSAGTVSSSPAGINACAADCSANFPSNTVVILTATPDPADQFANWGAGDCATAATNPVCTISLGTTNVSAIANFID